MKLSQVVVGLMAGAALMTVSIAQVHADQAAQVKESMAMLKTKLNALGAPKLVDGVISFGTTEINGNYDVVDEVADAHDCTATVFMKKDDGFQRIATNVIKEGKRAIGTMLDPNGPAIPMIRKGEAYYGEADILGSKYETGYEPIKNAAGETIGVYYVGYKK